MTSSPKNSSFSRRPPRQTRPPWARRVGERWDHPPLPWLQVNYLLISWKPWSGISFPMPNYSSRKSGLRNYMAISQCLGGSFTLLRVYDTWPISLIYSKIFLMLAWQVTVVLDLIWVYQGFHWLVSLWCHHLSKGGDGTVWKLIFIGGFELYLLYPMSRTRLYSESNNVRLFWYLLPTI